MPAPLIGYAMKRRRLKRAPLLIIYAAIHPRAKAQGLMQGFIYKEDYAPPQKYTATNKNNQTTSTKCQYSILASKPW